MENSRLHPLAAPPLENSALHPLTVEPADAPADGFFLALAPAPADSAAVNPACSYLASLGTEAGRRVMRSALDRIARQAGRDDHADMPWWLLSPADVQAVRSWLADPSRFAPATGRRMLAAVRGVIREGWRLGHYDAERRERLLDVRPIGGSSPPRGRSVTPGQLAALFDAAAADHNRTIGARDAAALACLYAGLRRAEAAGLDVADWDAEASRLTVRFGKGGKSRVVPVPSGSAAAIGDWLSVRGDAPGALLVAVSRTGRVSASPLRPAAIERALTKLARRARIPGADTLRPHDLRRSFAGDFLDSTSGDLALLAGLLGHARVDQSARYDRRPDAAARRRGQAARPAPRRGRRPAGGS
ncbi:MAG: site-specific integrase [Chloroflexota bacterium]